MVRYLVEECRSNISHRDTNQETPLHFAVLEGKAKIAEYLISQGAEVNSVDDAGQTPLHLAVLYGRDEIAKHLITKGRTDVNAFDINGNTPLHHAAIKNNIDMVHYLIKNGADIYEKNVDKQTPIDILKANGHEVKGIIRQFGLNKTLISAVENNDIAKVKMAIRNGADSNAKTRSGETIIDLVVSGGQANIEIIRFLRQQDETKSLRRVKRSGGGSVSTYSDSDSGIESDNENTCEEGRSSSIIGNFVSRVKRSISGFFDYSSEESPKPIEVKNYVPGSTRIDTEPVSITENIDVNGNLLLLNVLVRKVTGKGFVSCSHSISPEEATGCAMSITHEFERGIRKAAKDSKCKISKDLGYLLFSNVFSDVKKSLIQGNYSETEGILYSFAKNICPKNNKKFMRFVDIEIKNMLTPQDSKIMRMDALRKDQPSSLVNQVDIQSMSQRRLIA
ncbi:MAG: ankyrin repeat domain-containing protein [Wolbachia endosymbiont of Fragariocoptes setiger]|nr:ankyrin repeat domain-containing protein [Wolbachia endosymbiont of Fragariocoptes setiger]